MIKENIKLNRFGIYYTPRKYLEENVSNEIKILKKKIIKKRELNHNIEKEKYELKLLQSNRPCVILKIYKRNITLIPMTRSDADESNIPTDVFTNKEKKSHIKTSVLVTMSIEKFKKFSDRHGNLKLPQTEIENLLKILQKHYLQ